MAKYTVKHICGHDHTHILFGKGTDRQRKLEWLSTVDCPECYKAKQQAEKDAANEQAKKENQEAGLPELVDGTPKQVAWAETIRANKVVSLNNLLKELKEFIEKSNNEQHKADCLCCIKIVESYKAQNSAVWWIDNRHQEFSHYWLNEQLVASTKK